MKKLHRGGSNPDGEPLSAGRVEYLEAARQRVRRRRLRRTVIILAALILVTLFATGAVGATGCANIAARKDAEIVLAPFSAQGRFRRSQELGREWFMCAYERKRYGCSEASLLVSKCASR